MEKREMGQWIVFAPHTSRPEFNPQYACKKPGPVVKAFNPCRGEMEMDTSGF